MANLKSRRTFLARTGLAAGWVRSPRRRPARRMPKTANLPPNVPQWMKEPGEPVNWRAYGLPSEFEKHVVKFKRPSVVPTEGVSLTPFQHLYGIITPSGVTFERQHAGVPNIDPAQHRLMLHGLVKRPLVFTMDDLSASRRCRASTSSSARATPRATGAVRCRATCSRRTACCRAASGPACR